MGRARTSLEVPGPVSEAEELWYDTSRWPSWVDGLAHVAKVQGDWPREGSSVVWDSGPAGRGRVIEQVTRYEVRVGQVLAVEDSRLRGTQEVVFEPIENGVSVSLALEYELKERGPLGFLADFFVRRALRDSLRRSLIRFGRELRADRELL
jgi:hypothetical protein